MSGMWRSWVLYVARPFSPSLLEPCHLAEPFSPSLLGPCHLAEPFPLLFGAESRGPWPKTFIRQKEEFYISDGSSR